MERYVRCGWIRQQTDPRDFKYQLAKPRSTPLPNLVDLRPQDTPIYDQGDLGSCTANAIAGAMDFERQKQGLVTVTPSRLFIYYNERDMEGTTDEDAGAMIRDGIKSVATLGVCPEAEWPYDVRKFTTKPDDGCYRDALRDHAIEYQAINNSDIVQLKDCLADGYPFVFGATLYNSFRGVDATGYVWQPGVLESDFVIGGHALMCVGYDDTLGVFIVRNSWGPGWGHNGYCYFPQPYMRNPNLCNDFWTIRTVSA